MNCFVSKSRKIAGKHLLTLVLLFSAGAAKAEEDYVEKSFNPIYSYIIVGGLFVAAIVIYSVFKKIDDKKKKKIAQYRAQNKQASAGKK